MGVAKRIYCDPAPALRWIIMNMNETDVAGIRKFLDIYYKESIGMVVGQRDVESNLQMKYAHSLEVHALTCKLAAELHLDNPTTLKARAAALLHDIGRFPQIIKSHTYTDARSVDHSHLGVIIVRENQVIDHLGIEASEVIKTAVRNHSTLSVPSEIVGRTRTITEVLRDADKIDIIRISIDFHSSEIAGRKTGWYTDMSFAPTCNSIVTEALLAGKAIPVTEIKTVYDEFLLYLSWVNDFQFDYSVRHVAELGRWEYMVKTLPDDTLRNHVTNYINRRIDERCSARTK